MLPQLIRSPLFSFTNKIMYSKYYTKVLQRLISNKIEGNIITKSISSQASLHNAHRDSPIAGCRGFVNHGAHDNTTNAICNHPSAVQEISRVGSHRQRAY